MNLLPDSPLTWADVARTVARQQPQDPRPQGLLRVRVDWSGLEIEADGSTSHADILEWLEKLFPRRLRRDTLHLELDGPEHARNLPVQLSSSEATRARMPSFGIVDGFVDLGTTPRLHNTSRTVPVVASLSVKGGTGRTTTAVTFALHWARLLSEPVLLVDADLEAPGLSYLFENIGGEAKISLEDLIVLAHAEDELGAPNTVQFVADRLKDHFVHGNLFILPLRRDLEELAGSSIRPEHLATPTEPFALADLLSKVADRLGCKGVVVDVRAGLVPLGVNLAMDPEVSPIIVSTLTHQSLKATSAFVRFLSRELRRFDDRLRKPLLVINRVPLLFRQSGLNEKLTQPLIDDLTAALINDTTDSVSPGEGIFDNSEELEPFALVQVPEITELQVGSGDWDLFREQIGIAFSHAVGPAFDEWISGEIAVPLPPSNNDESVEHTNPAALRQRLADHADQLIAAENVEGGIEKPLVTKPLAELATRFQSEPPIAVSEGAKGTGKTLAARFFVSQGTWQRAVQELSGRSGAPPSLLVPVCASVQSSAGFQRQVDKAREQAGLALGFGSPMPSHASTAWLREQISKQRSEQDWDQLWLDAIAWSVGLNVGESNAGLVLLDRLRSNGKSIVAVMEGLEELYTSTTDAGVQAAMRSALVSVPQRLRAEVRRPVGYLLFARGDTVQAAVKQNLDQYRREYSGFSLTWADDDVLELAAWTATRSKALPALWDPSFGNLSLSEKSKRLEPLWGRKLGPDDIPGKRIREAYTSTWIIAVLSDLQGRLVPRDLIRLLSFAARTSVSEEEAITYAGRLLPPRALKKAVEPTSEKKVSETEEEIAELQPVFEKFRKLAGQVTAPISAEGISELDLQDHEIAALKRHGIMLGDTPPFEVPELFRRGLRLRHAGARRRVVNLYRRARRL